MNPFPFPTPTRLAFSGDWHGVTTGVAPLLYAARNEAAEVLLQLGDFGFWQGARGARYLEFVNATAADLNLPIIFIDGNHENFTLLNSLPINEHGVRQLGTHLFHAPRNLRWSWGKLRFLAFGGATSLDRPYRIKGESWWPEEAHTPKQLAALRADGAAEVLLAHDCPAGVEIPGITHGEFTPEWDRRELERAWKHRENFTAALMTVSPTHIFHGHFHIYHQTQVELFQNPTIVTGLADEHTGPDEALLITDLAQIETESTALRASSNND